MDIQYAEKFFKQYDGSHFFMDREMPEEYTAYKNLQISKAKENQWRSEILDDYFNKMISEYSTDYWRYHNKIISILNQMDTDIIEYLKKLLYSMKIVEKLDKRQKILVIENMAGRTVAQKDGGYYLFASNGITDPVREIMKSITKFECTTLDNGEDIGWSNMPQRLSNAKGKYELAEIKFTKLKKTMI